MKKILMIEDDQIFANVYRNKLVLEGYEVEIAHDGGEGLELLRTYRPDAVILDLILPRVPGLEVIKRIRQEPTFHELPLIVFSNTYLTSLMQDAFKAGATKCLTKANCAPTDVISTLVEVLAASRANPSGPIELSSTPDPDGDFQAQLRRSFIESWPSTLFAIRSQLQSMIKADTEEARLPQIYELFRRVHAVTGSAGIVGMSQLSQMTDALEALLKELHEKPKNINASTLRTVAAAVDFLGTLFEQGKSPARESAAVRVLVVEDDDIARRAVLYALEKARLQSICVSDPLRALEVILENQFDLVFLDVGLPNINGFELCAKLRTLPAYKKTPVVFITGLNDFESRASSTMSGGNDFIGKPFLFVELAVKALVYALRGRVQAAKG